MIKMNFIPALALAALFAFGTTAIAAEKYSQDMKNQKGQVSQTQMQKDQKQHMNNAATKNRADVVPIRANKIIGMKVTNDKGESLGKINNLLINKDGSVAFAIISYGGFIESHLIPIQWRDLKPGPKDREFSVPFTKAQFDKTPKLRFNQLVDTKNPGWEKHLGQYYTDLKSGQMSQDWGKSAAHGNQANERQKQTPSMNHQKDQSNYQKNQSSAHQQYGKTPAEAK